METTKIDIAACTDKWYIMPTGVMMTSVCVNNPDVEIIFHIIHDDSVSDKDRADLEDTIARYKGKSIVFYAVDVTRFPSFPAVNKSGIGFTPATYYRLMLSEILPDIPRVIYLDCDIIVRHSLVSFWNTDIDNMAVGVVPDFSEGIMEYYDRLDYASQFGYFNSGVMLVNLNYWRSHDVVTSFMNYIQNNAHLILKVDQDVLNVFFKDCKATLPITYNLAPGFLWDKHCYDYRKYEKEVLEARQDPVIVHYAGNQPWQVFNGNPVHPFASSFFKYQNMTKWKGVKLDKRTFYMRVRNSIGVLLRKLKLIPQPSYPYKFVEVAPIDND